MSTIFQNKNIKNDFDEALLAYVKQEEESFSKSKNVKNNSLMVLIVVNFALLIGLSAYNFWQFRIVTGLDQPEKSN